MSGTSGTDISKFATVSVPEVPDTEFSLRPSIPATKLCFEIFVKDTDEVLNDGRPL